MLVLVGLGSNQGAKSNLSRTLELLNSHPHLKLVNVSSIFRSPAQGSESAPPYLNGTVVLETVLTPVQLKQELRAIEASLGRVRTGQKQTLVPIDLDLLLIEDKPGEVPGQLSETDNALVKLASLHEPYHLIPAAEIAPEWRDPVSGLSLRKLADLTYPMELEKVVL